MASTSLAHPGTVSTNEPLPAYALRGLGLFEVRKERILEDYLGAGRWLIPSGTTSGQYYEVRPGITSTKRDKCECWGFSRHRHCSHLEAARRASVLSAVCDCCGARVWWHQLTEVTEDDGLLGFYPGDVVCRDCEHEGRWA